MLCIQTHFTLQGDIVCAIFVSYELDQFRTQAGILKPRDTMYEAKWRQAVTDNTYIHV